MPSAMPFCNNPESDLPKSIRSSLLKQANQRSRIVPYHERTIPPPVGAILDSHSLGASVSSLSSGDTGAYDAACPITKQPEPVPPKQQQLQHRNDPMTATQRRPNNTTVNRKDALQKHRRNFHPHALALQPKTHTTKGPPTPEHHAFRRSTVTTAPATTPTRASIATKPALAAVVTRTAAVATETTPTPMKARSQTPTRSNKDKILRQETRDDILSKAREAVQRHENRDATVTVVKAGAVVDNTASVAAIMMGKIDRNEILQLLQDDGDDTISLSSRDLDIKSAAGSKTDVVSATNEPPMVTNSSAATTTKPLNLPNHHRTVPTKHLDLDSCFTGSTCSTITASVGYVAPHHCIESRVEAARRHHRNLEAAYRSRGGVGVAGIGQRPISDPSLQLPAATAAMARKLVLQQHQPHQQQPPGNRVTFARPRTVNDPGSLRLQRSRGSATTSTDNGSRTVAGTENGSRAATVKAGSDRLIMRDGSLYTEKILREDHSEHEI